jgi:pilus assembly protein Flp/PilA
MLGLVKRFSRDDAGATATEYAMLVVFVALAIAVGAQTLGGGINTIYSNISATISGTPMPKL